MNEFQLDLQQKVYISATFKPDNSYYRAYILTGSEVTENYESDPTNFIPA